MGSQGTPVLSWRVLALEYIHYDRDFRAELDFSLPWNSPTNSAAVGSQSYAEIWQCPEIEGTDANVTHYVAIVGPGTLWPDGGAEQLPDENNGAQDAKSPILLVEWPDSDIHWAEPRDLSVGEFLDWFRIPKDQRNTSHTGCLLYVDANLDVHELPLDTDPARVRDLLMVKRNVSAE